MSTPAAAMPQPQSTPRAAAVRRPTLRALPKLHRRHRGLTIGIVGLLLAALVMVLTVNIHVSNTQYRVVELQAERQLLVQQNQALSQQNQYLESPQALSGSAVDLGMVMPGQAGALDLESGAVAGEAEAADSADRPSSFVQNPLQPGSEGVDTLDVSAAAAEAPSGLLGAGALELLAQPTPGEAESSDAAEESGAAQPSSEYDGGTIPAPSWD
ncbi:septum formation initiator family protein [Nesterenkonia marinintestina]|uniref:septum formation initiator family protein n=1 Tax=Nesterenkonia marinintestina TaxID=2979865 RepID=UPI0021C04735|nr:septum formation initiator family protein [Nesterenkonia sp. GX14115]